ncbi:unnamed protein product, partial [marine sediment metagenome]
MTIMAKGKARLIVCPFCRDKAWMITQMITDCPVCRGVEK